MHLLTHKPDKIGSAIQEAKEFFVYRVADNTIPDKIKHMENLKSTTILVMLPAWQQVLGLKH